MCIRDRDIPAIIVNSGPMLGGVEFDGRKTDMTSVDEAMGMMSAGKISKEEFGKLENLVGPGCGSCSFLGTANTMCCVTEAMGMSLPGSALVPAVYAERLRVAFYSGIKICELAKKGITARQIITKESIKNGIKVAMGICGSKMCIRDRASVSIIHNEPDGTNINENCGSTHIDQIKQFVKENGADIGFAFDGDADRCLAVDENGELIDGDKIRCV